MGDKVIQISMAKFDHQKDDWRIYKTRLPAMFDKLKIQDGDAKEKKAVLLDCLCMDTYTELYGILYPSDPSKKTYDEIIKELDDHFSVTTILYVERKKFFRAQIQPGENAQEFLNRLRKIATKCEFGGRLNDLLCDIFVAGLDGKVFDRLCDEDNLTLEKALTIAKKYELKFSEPAADINWINRRTNHRNATGITKDKSRGATPKMSCNHCGYKNHYSTDCRFKNVTCRRCNKRGHMEAVCDVNRINAVSENSFSDISKNDNFVLINKNDIEALIN